MSSMWLRVDGVDGYSIGTHTDPTWETLATGGCGAASTVFSTATRAPHRALRRGSRFEIMCGTDPVYTGKVTEYDRQTGELHAKGMGLWLYDVLALDSLGATTRGLSTSVTQAIAAGRWEGTNPFGVSGPVAGDPDGNPISIGQLLDQYCEQTGQWWGTDARGALYVRPMPTTPDWIIAPDGAVFGEATENSPKYLAGRYLAAGGVYETAFAGDVGEVEDSRDLTDRGELTLVAAEAILAGMIERNRGVSWTNPADLTAEQITTVGGSDAFLPTVTALQLMRSFGAGYLDFGLLSLDTMIGKTIYTAGAPTIRVEPINTAPRTLRAVTAAA